MSATQPQNPVPLIVHVVYSLGTGGLENGLVNIINRIPPGRYRHAIICLTQAGEFAKRIVVPDVQIIELHKEAGNDLKIFWKLLRRLKSLDPAIVHTRNLAALETQILGLLMPRVRRIHGEHGRDVADLDGSNRRYQWLRRLLSPLIDRFVCVSKDLATWLEHDIGIDAGKIVQIYNGVDHQKFSGVAAPVIAMPAGFLPQGRAIVLGTVGRLAEVKDQASLICAVAHILRRRPHLRDSMRVIIVGDGPMRESLQEQAAPYEDVFFFAGDRSDVAGFLTSIDVFVLPSLGEGISNTILEAMSCGIAVVASDVGGNPELVEDHVTGRLFPVGDSSALADCVLELIDDASHRNALGEAALELVRARHDWSQTVVAYLKLYDGVLGTSATDGVLPIETEEAR